MLEFFDKKKVENIYMVGDLDCQSYKLLMKIELRQLINSHLIIIGNFGIGTLDKSTEKKNLSSINRKLKSKNNKIYLLRGNLDNEKLFEKYIYSNIEFPKDYDVVSIERVKFMFVGGSENYDRYYHFNHSRKKPTTFREFDMPAGRVDVVVSHESTDFDYPYNLYNLKSFSKTDKWIYNDVKKKREKLSKIYESIKKKNIKYWFSGKYGKNVTETKNNTKFVQLKKMEIVKLDID